MNDFEFVKKSAFKAGQILGLTDWFDDIEFLRIYKYLHITCGGDEVNMRHWMNHPNSHLDGCIPSIMISTEKGIQSVLNILSFYVDG